MPDKNHLVADSLGAFINTDWAISERGLAEVRSNYSVLPVLRAQNSDPSLLEAYESERLDSAISVKIRMGVAIIEITGPIFDSFNWYMYYFGGTCLKWVARDLQSCLDNPNVHAILVKFHTPGGGVTGVNEMGKMLRAARAVKPIAAYAYGYMCSAGLWLGVQAGSVIVDETAVVGSLGVYTAFLDDRKWMEKLGFEELEFVSAQSPYKNVPAYTDEGKKRIQKRLNSLCEVFGSEVALGRETTIEKVWKNFGQGDVFVGQEAIDAGLADSTGTFEETLRALSKTHAPHLYDGDEAAAALPTLNFSEKAESTTVEEEPAALELAADDSIEKDQILNEEKEKEMSNQNQQPAAADNAATADNKTTETPIAGTEAGNTALTEQLTLLTKQLQESNERAEKAEAAQKEAEVAREKQSLETAMEKVAEEFAGDKTAKKDFLVKLAQTFGKDSAEVKEYISDQKALNNQVAEGNLFQEAGSSASGDKETAAEKVDKMARERAGKDNCTYEQAYTKILAENPKLYSEIENEG